MSEDLDLGHDSFYLGYKILSVYDVTLASCVTLGCAELVLNKYVLQNFSFTRLTKDHGVPSVICIKSVNHDLTLRAILTSTSGTSC